MTEEPMNAGTEALVGTKVALQIVAYAAVQLGEDAEPGRIGRAANRFSENELIAARRHLININGWQRSETTALAVHAIDVALFPMVWKLLIETRVALAGTPDTERTLLDPAIGVLNQTMEALVQKMVGAKRDDVLQRMVAAIEWLLPSLEGHETLNGELRGMIRTVERHLPPRPRTNSQE